MKNKKVFTMLASLGLVGVIATGGTLAYLSSQSNLVNNTFTVGKGFIPGTDDDLALKIDETDINNPGERTDHNDYIDLYPGDVMVKDPTVYLTSGSVESYVFVKVTGVDELEAVQAKFDKQLISAFDVYGWDTSYWQKVYDKDGNPVTPEDKDGNGYYVANLGKPVDLSKLEIADGQYIKLGKALFTNVKMDEKLTSLPDVENLDGKKLPEINISACAVQYTDGQSVEEAFSAATFK